METIHLKTVDPASQELLKSAYLRGIKLSWNRYEKLQPQDGFLRLGLSCPYGCMQGPCRIDPFGRGADRGVCGLDKDRMVAAMLLRLSLSGAMEAMAEAGSPNPHSPAASSLAPLVARATESLGGRKLSVDDLSSSALNLRQPAEPAEALVTQALRLGVLAVASLADKKGESTRSLKIGYGLLAQGPGAVVGVAGRPDPAFLEKIKPEIARRFPSGWKFVSLGDWVSLADAFIPIACTSGEKELALVSGRIQMAVLGPGTQPSMIELCRTLNIPFASANAGGQGVQQTPAAGFAPDPSMVDEVPVYRDAAALEDAMKKEGGRKWVLVGGSDHPQHPLGWIPSEVGFALRGKKIGVAAWGDAALWMVKRGLARDNDPVRVLDAGQGPMLAAKALAGSGKTADLGICFAGLETCKDFSLALGLAALGLKVMVANPLPLWGSENVRNILGGRIGAGGTFTHFDHPAQPQEILEWAEK
ncbi:MAG TPA: hypothetical protein VLS90_12235 [Thermodesulfobacteriota bacterium]|nr:hypothetical protein [Thermodesulfobacteriota bacterium]